MVNGPFKPSNDVNMSGMAANSPEVERVITPRGAPTPQLARGAHTSLTHEDSGSEHGFSPPSSHMGKTPTISRPQPKTVRFQPNTVGLNFSRPNNTHHGISLPDASHLRVPGPRATRPEAPESNNLQQSTTHLAGVSKPKGYPEFDDGDVVIISPTGRKWVLHSMVLSNASPRLKELFNSTEAVKLSKKDRNEGKNIRWNLTMCPEPMAQELDPERLTFKWFMPLPANGRMPMSMLENINGLGAEECYNKTYDNFFRCIYSLDPIFTNDTGGDGEGKLYILDASKLLQAAVFLGSVHKVRVIIEAHLLRLNQLLWHHISNRPEGWVHLAVRLQSPLMFREAMLHIVGKFHLKDGVDEAMLKRAAFGDQGLKVWNLIVKKARELKELKLFTERHLLEYYPTCMVHKEDEGDIIPGRATYANDIYLWMALSLFRQYVSSAYLSNFHHRAEDGGLSFYRTLGSADATYLRGDTLKRFHGSFDMSSKGKACMAAAVEVIKTDIKPIVAQLLVDRSQATRDPQAPRLRHLTCTEIADDELPWYKPQPAKPVVSGDGDVEMPDEQAA